jgi:hypothetical protein
MARTLKYVSQIECCKLQRSRVTFARTRRSSVQEFRGGASSAPDRSASSPSALSAPRKPVSRGFSVFCRHRARRAPGARRGGSPAPSRHHDGSCRIPSLQIVAPDIARVSRPCAARPPPMLPVDAVDARVSAGFLAYAPLWAGSGACVAVLELNALATLSLSSRCQAAEHRCHDAFW